MRQYRRWMLGRRGPRLPVQLLRGIALETGVLEPMKERDYCDMTLYQACNRPALTL